MKYGRLHLRLKPSLLKDIRAYAERRHTSISELVRQCFVHLLDEEKKAKDVDAESI